MNRKNKKVKNKSLLSQKPYKNDLVKNWGKEKKKGVHFSPSHSIQLFFKNPFTQD